MSAKITALLEGVPNFLRKLELANEETRARTKAAIRRGTQAVVTAAEQRVPKRSGELAYTIRAEFATDGMVGYAKAGFGKLPRRSRASTTARRARAGAKRQLTAEESRLQFRLAPTSRKALAAKSDLGVYAPVVERGDPRRHHRPHPYMIPALQAERPTIIDDLKQAATGAVRDAGVAQ